MYKELLEILVDMPTSKCGYLSVLTRILFGQGLEDQHYFEGWVKSVFAMELC